MRTQVLKFYFRLLAFGDVAHHTLVAHQLSTCDEGHRLNLDERARAVLPNDLGRNQR